MLLLPVSAAANAYSYGRVCLRSHLIGGRGPTEIKFIVLAYLNPILTKYIITATRTTTTTMTQQH